MRIYLIKIKGAVYWGNFRPEREIKFSDGKKIFADLCFFRKKDAHKYLHTLGYCKEFQEVVGATIDNVKIKKVKR